MSNATQLVQNAFFLYPSARTPGLPFYAAPPYPSNFYYYWVYQEFYTNATKYLGELLGSVGVQYLLVFYGVQSASYYPYFLQFSYGKNASQLLEYQSGIVPVITAKDFAIYRNLDFSSVASSLANLSVVTGGYAELNAMAYGGVNLSSQGIIFPSDLPTGGCPQYFNRVDRIYTGSSNSLDSIALVCEAVSSSNPLSSIPAGSESWISSYQNIGVPILNSWPVPLAASDGASSTLDVPFSVGGCSSSCALWLPVRFSGDGGLLEFQWDSNEWTVNTTRGWEGNNNTMVWVQLPLALDQGSGILRVTPLQGWNAIGTVYVASPPLVAWWLQNLVQTKTVLMMSPGESLQAPLPSAAGQESGYFTPLLTAAALDGQALYLQAAGTSPLSLDLTLPAPSGGWLSMLIRSLATGDLIIGQSSSQVVGFDTGDYNASNLSMAWLRVPISTSEIGENNTLPIVIANGSVWISEITFTPFSTYPQPVLLPTDPICLFNPSTSGQQ